ncbi:HD-GYP domain-containing protein [Sphingomicrobium aestuariivivum]|uniref:HD-GYP domain-containing protein n=1 Tax=Sphingomicrobium aestuariivivum TaxID=1582356 RepID=UPI001FD671EC|nr:HD-GYP domain-containing protein [Sphingomicrobium aestuariivivum]MCJ8190592.1 HD domain-containing protein [Sphingomicrobium aestuariivivum]
MTEGQPAGHSLRCAYAAGWIARALGLSAAERHRLHYAVLLKDLGCSSNAARIAELYATDDRDFKARWKTVPEGLPATLRFVFARTGAGAGLRTRVAKIANILRNGDAIAQEMIETRCTRGADIARRLRFDEGVAAGIFSLDEHWDGSGRPEGLSGDDIPLEARIALLCQVVDVFHARGGREAARAEVARRAGSWLDPRLAACFQMIAGELSFWRDYESPQVAVQVAALAPPEEAVAVDEDYLDDIAAAFGAVVDAKSPYTGGHSGRVAGFAGTMAEAMGMAPAQRRWLHRAALLHDVGKLGVSSRVLEKPGRLGEEEWTEMRAHAAQTHAILSRVGCMADMAEIAAAHHERLDGSGYPLGLGASEIGMETRIITACDFYDALTADRPYRAALAPDEALAIMEREVGTAVDGDCFEALRSILA